MSTRLFAISKDHLVVTLIQIFSWVHPDIVLRTSLSPSTIGSKHPPMKWFWSSSFVLDLGSSDGQTHPGPGKEEPLGLKKRFWWWKPNWSRSSSPPAVFTTSTCPCILRWNLPRAGQTIQMARKCFASASTDVFAPPMGLVVAAMAVSILETWGSMLAKNTILTMEVW